MDLLNVYKKKIDEVEKIENLNRGQKKMKVSAFITNTLKLIDCFVTKEINNPSKDYHYVSQQQMKRLVYRDSLRFEALNFLKNENIVDVLKKNGKEYYVHFEHKDLGFNIQPKAYKITEFGYELLNNSFTNPMFDKFLEQYKVERKKYKPITPEEVMAKYKDEDYYFVSTKSNIIDVLNNNLELEFHPLSDEEMIKIYKQEKKNNVSDEDIKIHLNMVKDYFANKEFTYNIRMYSAFTNTPKCWRQFITNSEGKKIVELFDIHSSVLNILPLVCMIIMMRDKGNNQVDYHWLEKETQLLEDFLDSRDVYKLIGGEEYSREEIKKELMHVLFSNNKSFELQRTPKGKVKRLASNRIKMWLKDNFPVMFDIVANFEEKHSTKEIKQYKKIKSMFWLYFQKMETELMSMLNCQLSNHLGTKVYNIHDGCFVSEEFVNEKNKEYCRQMYKMIKGRMKEQIENRYKIKRPHTSYNTGNRAFGITELNKVEYEDPNPLVRPLPVTTINVSDPTVTNELVATLTANIEE